jgi:phytoene/squalene synthetase
VDLSAGGTGLVYFPRQDLEAFQLSVKDLHRMKAEGKASKSYIRLAGHEAQRAQEHLTRGLGQLPDVLAAALPSHGRALTFLIDTYQAILHDLAQNDFDVFANSPAITD